MPPNPASQPPAPEDFLASRQNGRALDELRPVSLEPRLLELHPASCLVRFGRTWVLCTASVADQVPPFLAGRDQGWVTAQYGMMPGSVPGRIPPSRNSGGRAEEISRLIGRSLRAAVDLSGLGLRTVTIDCQVLQADGGTRTAAVTGGYVALALALADLAATDVLPQLPSFHRIAAISVGVVGEHLLLDLDQAEDTRADADLNVVMTETGTFVEIQGTAEGRPFDRSQLNGLLDLAQLGIGELLEHQRRALESVSS